MLVAGLGVAAAAYYAVRSGRLPLQSGSRGKAETVAPAKTYAIVLEPLLVNLAEGGGSSYLRVALTLRVAETADKVNGKGKEERSKDDKDPGEAVAAVRDTALTVLGGQTAGGLLAADGKDRLKSELKMSLAKHNADLKVMDIFFTDFLVQQ